jgi:hypothetical protein
MRSVVLIRGLLIGRGYEVPCEMLAMRDSQAQPGRTAYSRCSVIEAPAQLPDGEYTVTFHGYSVPARKEGGLWVPDEIADPVVPILMEKPVPPVRSFRLEEAVEILPALKNHVA